MYSRPKFLEELHAIREEMSRESDYDMDLFAMAVRQPTVKTPKAVSAQTTSLDPKKKKKK